MKKIFLIPFGLVMGSFIVVQSGHAQKHVNIFNNNGNYQGRMDANGNVYDGNGNYKGRIDSNGNVYNSTGAYKGRVDAQRKETGLPLLN